MDDLRRQAAARLDERLPRCRTAAIVIIVMWCVIAAGAGLLLWNALRTT